MITKERYSKHMQTVAEHSGCVFLQFRMDHCRYLKGDCSAAAVLSYLLNLLRMKHSNATDRRQLMKNDLYFKCPAGEIQEKFGMGEDRQRTAIKNLRDAQLIHTKNWTGFVMWVKVDDVILRKVQKEDMEEQDRRAEEAETMTVQRRGFPAASDGGSQPLATGVPSRSSTNNLSEESSNRCPAVAGNTGFFFNSLNGHADKPEYKLAARLADVIKRHRRDRQKIHLPSWASRFKELLRTDKEEDILESIRLHDVHLRDKYWPKKYAAKTFCEDYDKILDAIERLRESNVEERPKYTKTVNPDGTITRKIIQG